MEVGAALIVQLPSPVRSPCRLSPARRLRRRSSVRCSVPPPRRRPPSRLALICRLKSAERQRSEIEKREETVEPRPPSGIPSKDKSPVSSGSNRLTSLVGRIGGLLRQTGEVWKSDGIVLEIASIALPAALALAADPLTSVVDTAFIGHVGSVELAAVGVSISVFNLASKLFNVPLLNITTSFVAEEQALNVDVRSQSKQIVNNTNGSCSEPLLEEFTVTSAAEGKKFLPTVSTSLIMAAGIGIVEAVALYFGSGILVDIMGVVANSPMRVPAEQFLSVRALGAPAIILALAAQGTFRGFKDTKTPLYAVGAGNLLNAILDPILMFTFGLGVEGAGMATVIADYMIAFILLWKLNEEISLVPSNIDWKKLLIYLKSGGLLIARTLAVVGTMTLSTSLAARSGPIPMAGHEICLQVWLAISLLNDALALAGQALLASEYAKGNYQQARAIIYRVIQIGFVTGLALASILYLEYGSLCSLFTEDPSVLEIARSGTLFVSVSQPINALAFVIDGLYYGVSDFAYAASSMVLTGMLSSLILLIMAHIFGLAGVWAGLFIFMTLRVAAGLWRLGSRDGPWRNIWSENKTALTNDSVE